MATSVLEDGVRIAPKAQKTAVHTPRLMFLKRRSRDSSLVSMRQGQNPSVTAEAEKAAIKKKVFNDSLTSMR